MGEPIAPQLGLEKELLVMGNGADPDPRGTGPPPAALRDEWQELQKNNQKVPTFFIKENIPLTFMKHVMGLYFVEKPYSSMVTWDHSLIQQMLTECLLHSWSCPGSWGFRDSPCPCEIHSLEGERVAPSSNAGGSLLRWGGTHSFSCYHQMPGCPTGNLLWSRSSEPSSLAGRTTHVSPRLGKHPTEETRLLRELGLGFPTVKWGNLSPQSPLSLVDSPPFGWAKGSLLCMMAQMKQPCRWKRGHPHWPLCHSGSWPDGDGFSGGRNRVGCERQHKSELCLAVDCSQCRQAHIRWAPAVCKSPCSFLTSYKTNDHGLVFLPQEARSHLEEMLSKPLHLMEAEWNKCLHFSHDVGRTSQINNSGWREEVLGTHWMIILGWSDSGPWRRNSKSLLLSDRQDWKRQRTPTPAPSSYSPACYRQGSGSPERECDIIHVQVTQKVTNTARLRPKPFHVGLWT